MKRSNTDELYGNGAALRGAATLKARTMKEVWNIAAVLPVEKGVGACVKGNTDPPAHSIYGDEIVVPEKDFLGVCIKEFLARGSELLKRTRKGRLASIHHTSHSSIFASF